MTSLQLQHLINESGYSLKKRPVRTVTRFSWALLDPGTGKVRTFWMILDLFWTY